MFVAEHFNELDSSPILPPHSHVILHVRLAWSCRIYISKSEGKFSPSGKDTRQTDEGWEKVIFSGPHPPSSATVPPLPESEDYLLGGWILRLRLRLRVE